MVNCYSVVSRKYNLNGYSPDTIWDLIRADLSEDKCFALFYRLEHLNG